MDLKKRITDLEKEVEELKRRIIAQPVYIPVPVYPQPQMPAPPQSPWYDPYRPTIICGVQNTMESRTSLNLQQ